MKFKEEIELPLEIIELNNWLADHTYENLTKIIRNSDVSDANKALRMPEEFMNDADALMGGGTCFSITYWLYVKMKELGYQVKLLMGHKRIQPNCHCALLLDFENQYWFFDPGYLIFDALPIPKEERRTYFPLKPNEVVLKRKNNVLALLTGKHPQFKLRFEFFLDGVSESDFKYYWSESFKFEMMKYPVLNRLDRECGIQYYYQKSNLMIRDGKSSQIIKLNDEQKVDKLHEIFKLDREIIATALDILS